MVGSSFILFQKNGTRALLNVAQITYASDRDVRLTAENRTFYSEFLPEQEIAYIIEVEFTDTRPIKYLYDKKEERDEMLSKLITAFTPFITIDSPPGLPLTWPEVALQEPKSKAVYKRYTAEEIDHAMAMLKVREQTPPPTPKPPRKPRAKKGEE
ncbi:hypothetical protein Q5H92_26540 [Hymenobacter sp. M29]|uniref:Uncharacterized protein n=1 Tax=Hymenobacter mellowenesis TaxID=3063995 RepID=A0ABT9AJC4_9BACT|nr:hypothetical protein [Hymenobacter sp. M29]MDO7849946.1 hypothetical protein [Hymenobacter sp. M29]